MKLFDIMVFFTILIQFSSSVSMNRKLKYFSKSNYKNASILLINNNKI